MNGDVKILHSMIVTQPSDHPFHIRTPKGFNVSDVTVRLAKPAERLTWDQLVNTYHALGFNKFTGRGLRYVGDWKGQWIALAGWQFGAFKCQPRDERIGWQKTEQYRRLHLIVNNMRFLIMGKPNIFPYLGSYLLSAMTRRISADWQKLFGHQLLLAETFVEQPTFHGKMYLAANWHLLGETKGYARTHEAYTKYTGKLKQIWVKPLRRDAYRILSRKAPIPESIVPTRIPLALSVDRMRSLYDELRELKDDDQVPMFKHRSVSVLAVHIMALLSNRYGVCGTSDLSKELNQEELKAVGSTLSKTGRFLPISKSAVHNHLQWVDFDIPDKISQHYGTPRFRVARKLADDIQRHRSLARNDKEPIASVAAIDHDTGHALYASYLKDSLSERPTVNELLKQAEVQGAIVSLDALRSARKTARLIKDGHRAEYFVVINETATETCNAFDTIEWDNYRSLVQSESIDLAYCRFEQRSIEILLPRKAMFNYPHLAQIARIRYSRKRFEREETQTVYVLTSLNSDQASPEELFELELGHRRVEHQHLDCHTDWFGEDFDGIEKNDGSGKRTHGRGRRLALIFSTLPVEITDADPPHDQAKR